jgi:hypothetical protein
LYEREREREGEGGGAERERERERENDYKERYSVTPTLECARRMSSRSISRSRSRKIRRVLCLFPPPSLHIIYI